MLNGFGYALFGVPSRDLETTWHDVTEITKKAAQSPLLTSGERPIQTVATAVSTICGASARHCHHVDSA